MIGPWILEWDKDEVVIPKACVSETAVLTADLPSLVTFENIDVILEKLGTRIIYWNTQKTYCLHPNEPKQGNAYDFVNDLINIIGGELPTDGPIGEFLSSSKRLGLTRLEFPISPEFKAHFNLKKDSEKFKTHEALDNFVNELLEIDEEFPTKFTPEYLFLKGIDRAFWMKSFHYENEIRDYHGKEDDEDLKKLKEELAKVEQHSCPFDDPRKTKSIIL